MTLRLLTMAKRATSRPVTGLAFLPTVWTVVGAIVFLGISVYGKDVPLAAIVLYDDADGAAYVQVRGVNLSGKTEVRACNGNTKFDKKIYGKLPKVPLKSAKSVERGADGVLMLKSDSGSICVVPGILGFEKKTELTTAEAADQAVLQGTIVSFFRKHKTDLPDFRSGVRVVFVAAPDTELAEYLRAERARSIEAWHRFLGLYGSSPHTVEAKDALAGLYQE